MTEAGFATDPPTCLTDRLLPDLSRGTLSGMQIRALVDHLPRCERCARSLRTHCESQASTAEDRDEGTTGDATSGSDAAGDDAPVAGRPGRRDGAMPAVLKTYAVLGKIGQGGMGVVYDAWNVERGTRVALKTLPRVDATALYRFKREFRARADLVHRNLITLHELVSDRGRWFFTMDRLDGVDFLAYVRGVALPGTGLRSTEADPDQPTIPDVGLPETEVDDSPGDRPPGIARPAMVRDPGMGDGGGAWRLGRSDGARLCEALRQLAEGLMAVHEASLLHRDLKPSNVMVEAGGRLVILDFGLVAELVDAAPGDDAGDGPRSGHPVHHPTSRRLAGTAAYMAPEQAAGRPLTPACDWYGVGVMLYEALAGRRPFDGPVPLVLRRKQAEDPPGPVAVEPGIPVPWDELCRGLLARRPESRPTGRDLLRFLDREAPRADRNGHAAGAAAEAGPEPEPDFAPPPFVGREDALAALGAAFRAAGAAGSVLQLVHGPSGVGKSTILRRFGETTLRDAPAVVFRGRCYEHESVPYKALDSLIDDLARHLRRLPEGRLAELVAADLSPLGRLFPVFRGIGGVEGAAPADVEPQEQRRLAFAAFRRLLAGLARDGPVVLVIDDLQWGDVDGALLLIDLLRPPAVPGLLVVGIYRDEYAARSEFLTTLLGRPGGPAARSLAVGPLSTAEARDLIGRAAGAGGLDEGRTASVIREARGNPLFLHELVKSLQGDRSPAGLGAGGGVDLEGVIWSRVARLPADARRLLEVVAVAGRPIRQGSAYRAAGLLGRERPAAGALRSGRFVRSSGQGLDDAVESFHDSIRETVLRRLDPGRLGAHHRELARTLEEDGAADPETLAGHWIGAGEAGRAAESYAQAADRAAESLAFDRAARLYRLAETLRPLPAAEARPLRRKLAEALANAGRSHEAALAFRACAEGVAGPEWVELQRLSGYHFAIGGHLGAGRAVFDAILGRVGHGVRRSRGLTLMSILARSALLRLRGVGFVERTAAEIPPERLERLDILGSVSIGLAMVDPYLAVDFQKRCLLMALRLGEPRRVAKFLALHAAAVSASGEAGYPAAIGHLRRVEAIARRTGDPLTLAWVDLATGFAEYHVARWRATLEAMERAKARFLEHGREGAWERESCDRYILSALCNLGRFAELAGRRDRLRDSALERGDLLAQADLDTFLGTMVHLSRDDPAAARRELDAVLAHWTDEDYLITHLKVLAAATHLDFYEGRPAAAIARLRSQWGALERSLILHSQVIRVLLRHARGTSAAAAGAVESADSEGYLRAAEADARRQNRERTPAGPASAALIRGAVAAARGDAGRAAACLDDAAIRYAAIDMPAQAAAARLARGRIAGGPGGAAEARQAGETLRGLGVRNPDPFAAMLTGIRG